MGRARGAAIIEYAGVLAMMFVFGAAGAKALGVKVSARAAAATVEAAVAAPTTQGEAPLVDTAPSSTEKAPIVPSSTEPSSTDRRDR